MGKFKWLVVFVLFLIAVTPCFADDRAKVVGCWKLVSFETEYQATGQRVPIMGKNPVGYQIYTAEGRSISVITGEGRRTPTTDQDRSELWKSMLGGSGTYRVEGDNIVLKTDVSSVPAFVGTERVSSFRIDGDRLQITTPWMDAPFNPERGKQRTIITWERAK
jgi:hypothetical protein